MKEVTDIPRVPRIKEVINYIPYVRLYVFDNLVVGVDERGLNQKRYPELHFGVYDTNPEQVSFRPQRAEEGVQRVHMTYVRACVAAVANEAHIHSFWFVPHRLDFKIATTKDKQDPVNARERRGAARVKLLEKYFTIERSADGHGYLLKI